MIGSRCLPPRGGDPADKGNLMYLRPFAILAWTIVAAAACGADQGQVALTPDPVILCPRNVEVPFPYIHGGIRQWSILQSTLPPEARVKLTAKRDQQILSEGQRLSLPGLAISLTSDGRLRIVSDRSEPAISFDLQVVIEPPDGSSEAQTLQVRPAPPDRPLTYCSDFTSEVIRIFMSDNGRYRPVDKSAFDQYFRRIQAHGMNRLIVWLTPFPLIADPDDYPEADWDRYA